MDLCNIDDIRAVLGRRPPEVRAENGVKIFQRTEPAVQRHDLYGKIGFAQQMTCAVQAQTRNVIRKSNPRCVPEHLA